MPWCFSSDQLKVATHLSAVADIAQTGCHVQIDLHIEAGASEGKRVILQFGDETMASAWKDLVLRVWRNPFIKAPDWVQCLMIAIMFLQFIAVIGPIFGIFVMIWNAYVDMKTARQKQVKGERGCCDCNCCITLDNCLLRTLCCTEPLKNGIVTRPSLVSPPPTATITTINPLAHTELAGGSKYNRPLPPPPH